MGGVSIALEDRLADPFANPAAARRLSGTRLFSSPSYYSIGGNGGTGRTLPLGTLLRRDGWFGGMNLAVQELLRPDRNRAVGGVRFDTEPAYVGPRAPRLSESRANNLYVSALGGKDLTGENEDLTVAGSAFYGSLSAVEGVEMLYPRTNGVDQSGYVADVRLGLIHQGRPQDRLEAVFLFHRQAMSHRVRSFTRIQEDGTERTVSQMETNLDRTNTLGAHLNYVRSLEDSRTKVGAIATINRKWHPKIPNYGLMQIPRDPGNTYAFNVGTGLSHREGPVTMGVDLIYEPITSNTWAEANESITGENGEVLVWPGSKTVDNRFFFSNGILRFGLERTSDRFEVQGGIQIKRYDYHLEQKDFVDQTVREQAESWLEWDLGLGAGLNLPGMHLRYQLGVTLGTGRPGTIAARVGDEGARVEKLADAAGYTDVVLAPNGPLTLRDVKVFTHRLALTVPL